jgi:hypothetical protein
LIHVGLASLWLSLYSLYQVTLEMLAAAMSAISPSLLLEEILSLV